MHVTLVNLLGVATVAFCVPFILGFFPRVRIPAVRQGVWLSPLARATQRCVDDAEDLVRGLSGDQEHAVLE